MLCLSTVAFYSYADNNTNEDKGPRIIIVRQDTNFPIRRLPSNTDIAVLIENGEVVVHFLSDFGQVQYLVSSDYSTTTYQGYIQADYGTELSIPITGTGTMSLSLTFSDNSSCSIEWEV